MRIVHFAVRACGTYVYVLARSSRALRHPPMGAGTGPTDRAIRPAKGLPGGGAALALVLLARCHVSLVCALRITALHV